MSRDIAVVKDAQRRPGRVESRAARVLGHWAEPAWRDPLRRRLLAVSDCCTAAVVAAAFAVEGPAGSWRWAAGSIVIWLFFAKLFGLYDRDHRVLRHLTVDEATTVLLWTLGVLVAIVFAANVLGGSRFRPESLFGIWVVAAGVALTMRSVGRHAYRRIAPRERALVIGDGDLADAVIRKVTLFPDIHIDIVRRVAQVGPDELDDGAFWDGTERVIVASDSFDGDTVAHLRRLCRDLHLKLTVVPPARGALGTAVMLNHVADLSLLEYSTWAMSPSTLTIKRAIDIGGALVVLVLLSPLLMLIAVAIKLDSRGPVFFVQMRAGLGGKPFPMLKFRSMTADAEARLAAIIQFDDLDEPMFKLRRDPRITRVGRLLRRTSLDEVPQLLNVLAGHMSLVGPRPEQVELVERYAPEHRFRLDVRPGLTGPMQVYGRGALTFDERLAVERDYIENMSIGRDLRIIAMTVTPVLTGRGAY